MQSIKSIAQSQLLAADPGRPSLTWLALLAISGIGFVAYAVLQFLHTGTLPPPLFFDPNDTFMDFFNTTYWSFKTQRYETWRSVYPLFTFLIGETIGDADCSVVGALEMRECNIASVWPIFACYFVGIVLSARTYVIALKRTDVPTAKLFLLVFLAFSFSLPGLFALERGNYIVIAFMLLAASAWWTKDWRGAIALALAINLKQYLLIFWLLAVLKRRFAWVAVSVSAALAANMLAMLLVRNNHYTMVVENMVGYASVSTSYFEKLWYASSLGSWSRTIANSPHVGTQLWGYQTQIAYALLNGARWISVGVSVALMCMLCLRARKLEYEYMCFACLACLLVLTDGLGGYAILFLIPYCGVLVRRPKLRWSPLLLLILLTPVDLQFWPTYEFNSVNFFTGEIEAHAATLTLGSYIRPVALVIFVAYLLRDVFQAGKAPLYGNAISSRNVPTEISSLPATQIKHLSRKE